MTQIFDLRRSQQRKVEHLFNRYTGTQSGDNNRLAFCYKTLIIRLHFHYYKTLEQRFKSTIHNVITPYVTRYFIQYEPSTKHRL